MFCADGAGNPYEDLIAWLTPGLLQTSWSWFAGFVNTSEEAGKPARALAADY
ncbi:MAG TPA: hypothetical protein VG206_06635 [Terriglobia bacterium]|nr:hypothetical protein [Terriglobia bacterium]